MEFQDVVRLRRMVRQLSQRPVSAEHRELILQSAQRGPSSGYTQGVEFLVFDGTSEVTHFWAAVPVVEFVRDHQGVHAPLIIVPVSNSTAYVENYLERPQLGRRSADDFPAPYWFTDTGCAVMLILLAAVDLGLGAFWFSLAPNAQEVPDVKAKLGIPPHLHPVGAIAVGHPSADERDRSQADRTRTSAARRDPESRIHRGSW